jgi:hypothetical protein
MSYEPSTLSNASNEPFRRPTEFHDALELERWIKDDPMRASVDELAWLASWLEERTRVPEAENDMLQQWRSEPDGHIANLNDEQYLRFIQELLPVKAMEEQNRTSRELVDTNRELVAANRELVREARVSATATIWIAAMAVGALIVTVIVEAIGRS